MGLPLRDNDAHPYADCRAWPEDVRCARAGVPEVRLVHPIDRVVTVYRLTGSACGRPAVHETKGELEVGMPAGIRIDWDSMAGSRPASQ